MFESEEYSLQPSGVLNRGYDIYEKGDHTLRANLSKLGLAEVVSFRKPGDSTSLFEAVRSRFSTEYKFIRPNIDLEMWRAKKDGLTGGTLTISTPDGCPTAVISRSSRYSLKDSLTRTSEYVAKGVNNETIARLTRTGYVKPTWDIRICDGDYDHWNVPRVAVLTSVILGTHGF